MHLYDVGMSSMVAMELQALVNLSLSAFDPPRQDVHDKLLKQLTALKANIQKNLWNEKLGIFVNKWCGLLLLARLLAHLLARLRALLLADFSSSPQVSQRGR